MLVEDTHWSHVTRIVHALPRFQNTSHDSNYPDRTTDLSDSLQEYKVEVDRM